MQLWTTVRQRFLISVSESWYWYMRGKLLICPINQIHSSRSDSQVETVLKMNKLKLFLTWFAPLAKYVYMYNMCSTLDIDNIAVEGI